MSRFSYVDGKLLVDCEDGEVSPAEATACVLYEILISLNEIGERLTGIEHTLDNGELKIHRVN